MAEMNIHFDWQSTPRLWAAYRDFDGATGSRNLIGYGRTREEAEADLIEMEEVSGYVVCSLSDCRDAKCREKGCQRPTPR